MESPPDHHPPGSGSGGNDSEGSENHRGGRRPPSEERDPEELPPMPLGLRLAFYYLLFSLLMQLGGLFLLVLLMGKAPEAGQVPDLSLALAAQALLAPWMMMATRIFLERVDGKPLTAIGVVWPGGQPASTGRWLGAGFLLSVVLLAFWVGIVSLFGQLELEGWAPDPAQIAESRDATPTTPSESDTAGAPTHEAATVPTDALAEQATEDPPGFGRVLRLILFGLGLLVVAAIHEWGFRGYIYSALRDRLSWIHAAGLSALLYALFLVPAGELTAAGLTNILLIALVLASLRELSGNVWVGAVFHGSWNFLLGSILSLPVSGDVLPHFWVVTTQGPEPLTGGTFGPEGSWAVTGLLVATLFALVALIGDRPPLDPLPENPDED